MSQRKASAQRGGSTNRQAMSWRTVLVEGLVALGVGFYIALMPNQATSILLLVIGLYLAVSGALWIYLGIASGGAVTPPELLVRGGIELLMGLLVSLQPLTDYAPPEAVRMILGLGLLLSGAFGLYGIFKQGQRPDTWGPTVASAVNVTLALLLLYAAFTGKAVFSWIGLVATGLGLALIGYSFYLRRSTRQR